MKMQNSFSQFSYYEVYNGSNYISKFPSVNTTSFKVEIHSKLFNSIFEEHDLKLFLEYLKFMNFGFKDFIGYLLSPELENKTTFIASDICSHLSTLEIVSIVESDQYATIVEVVSLRYPTKFFLRIHKQSAPQKAIDTIPCYVDCNSGKIITTLGYKKMSKNITVSFSDGTNIDLLEIGLFGYINGAGEHVNARSEGDKVNTTIEEIKNQINNPTTFVLYKDVEIANRGLIEETGLDVANDEHVKFYIFGLNNKHGRDLRYIKHTFMDLIEFGYNRSSESILVVSIINAKPPLTLPDPHDLEEMEAGKSCLIEMEELIKEFKVGGKYSPAFPEHVNQLCLLTKKLPYILEHY